MRFLRGVGPKVIVRRLWRELQEDVVSDSAAQLAYYFLFSLFPILFFLVTLTAYLPLRPAVEEGLYRLDGLMPPEALALVRGYVEGLLGSPRPKLLTVGLLVALWTMSRGVDALRRALNLAYDVKESRPFWRTQPTSILVTVAGIVLVPTAFAGVVLGGKAGTLLAARLHVEQVFVLVWSWLRWPITALVVMLAAAVAYYLLPDVKQKWRYVTPGSVTATVLWLLVTWGFTFYVENFGSYDATYGSIGAVMVLLAWLYLTALSLVVGGAINAVLEQASVEGKAPGARAPGEAPPPREERAKAAPPGAAKSRSAAVRSGPPADPGLH
jgi:membrane protein